MEFKEFCKERDRMCKFYLCNDCPLHKGEEKNCLCNDFCFEHPDEAEKIVSEWAKENPFMTNSDKFKEVFGFGFIITSYGIKIDTDRTAKSMRKWLQQEYQPPREEETDGQS